MIPDIGRGFREAVAYLVGKHRAAIRDDPFMCPTCHDRGAVAIKSRLHQCNGEWRGKAFLRCQHPECGAEYFWEKG
jgi:hypothetical protein